MKRELEIHSLEAFKGLLERECARSDRNCSTFSVLSFRFRGFLKAKNIKELVNAAKERIRSTDEIGFFSNRRIGIFLPDTPDSGAMKLAGDLLEVPTVHAQRLSWEVYVYPDKAREGKIEVEENARRRIGNRGLPKRPMEIGPEIRNLEYVLAGGLPLWKRCLDLAGASIGLLALLPLLCLVAVAIKLISPGTIFFKQKRVGHLGKTFTVWKFRTMAPNADSTVHREHLFNLIHHDVPMNKLDDKDDRRIIPLGKFLRSSGIDELPQLINVIRGDMSLIGPRPCIPYEVREYDPWQRVRCRAVPGLTGLWQVNGKNRTTHKEMIRYDITYFKKRSFWMDVKILLKTPGALIGQLANSESAAERKERQYATGNY